MWVLDEARGSRSPESADGGGVALGLVLMSCFLSVLDHAPPALGSSVRIVRYCRVLQAVKEVVAKSRRNPDENALHSLRSGGAAARAIGRDISKGVIKQEGRWGSGTYNTYTRSIIEVSRNVRGKLVVASVAMGTQPGEGTAWGRKR